MELKYADPRVLVQPEMESAVFREPLLRSITERPSRVVPGEMLRDKSEVAKNGDESDKGKGIPMRGAVLYGLRDVRFEERDVQTIIKPTDAIISISATCACGSDLSPYCGISPVSGRSPFHGINPASQPAPMGHESCGTVQEVGRAVKSIKAGQFVIGSFFASDNTCPNCQIGYQSSCQNREFVSTAQAPVLRVPLAGGTLEATPDLPSEGLIPSLLTLSDVMGTGWFAADAAKVKLGSTVAVVGDGAIGLLGVLCAKQKGAERIIAMSRHQTRHKLADRRRDGAR